jgi:STE24 endopeptidase
MTFEGAAADTPQSSLPIPVPHQIESVHDPHKAKAYNRAKLLIAVVSSAVSFTFVLLLLASGTTKKLEVWARALVSSDYGALLLFAAAIGVFHTLLTLPFGFYSSYTLEHRYMLSNQSLRRWAWERLKGTLISLPLGVALLLLLYYCIESFQQWWWLPVSAALALVSIMLARLAPVLIFPLFYKFVPLESESLKERIQRLCVNAGVAVQGIFSFNLSKNTKKANAGFTGIGKAKRIILGDTLLKEFSEEQIEAVFAHELGHYTHKHVLKGIFISILSTVVGLLLTARLYQWSLSVFGLNSIAELAALPLLALWLALFGLVTTPLGNMLSRHFERVADTYAARTMGIATPFVSALRKLAAMNLADPDPHPLVEFMFYSHPSLTKRIRGVEAVRL